MVYFITVEYFYTSFSNIFFVTRWVDFLPLDLSSILIGFLFMLDVRASVEISTTRAHSLASDGYHCLFAITSLKQIDLTPMRVSGNRPEIRYT